jgi:hypothetical protein
METSGLRVIKIFKAAYVISENVGVTKHLMETKGTLLTG